MTTAPETQPISPLVADLITASMAMTHATTDQVIDNLEARVDDYRAELAAVRAGITGLLDGPYMPQPDAIRDALYPSARFVDHYRTAEGL